MKKVMDYLRKSFYLPILAITLIVIAFIVSSPKEVFIGYKDILISPSGLTTDFIAVGGLGAALFNTAIIIICNLALIRALDLRISGIIYAALYMIIGFSFYGKNILNTLPIYIGVFIYSRFNKVPLKNLIISLLFSSGIAPIVSYVMFGFGIKLYFSIPLGLGCGILAGMLVPPLSLHTIKFHQGYNLFNVGFALGIIAIAFNGIFRLFGYQFKANSQISAEHNLFLYIFLGVLIIGLSISALALEPKVIFKFPSLFKRSGRLVSDYARDYGKSLVMLNQAMILSLEVVICLIFKVKLNGAIFGTILAVSGFAGGGMHLKNVSIIYIGAIAMALLARQDMTASSTIIAILFSAALAPIAGRYKIIPGIIAGMLHVAIVPLCAVFQGGIDLYNNGFAAGFAACIIIAIIEAFKEEE